MSLPCSESPVTEKAGAILGINRAQSVQINGTDNKSEHTDPHHNQANPMVGEMMPSSRLG